MKKAITLLLLVVVFSAVFLSGCTAKTETPQEKEVAVTQPDVSTDEAADEAVTGWVDENEDVQLGEII
jgi:PBP1b-binding outer membrane lipoprotein LpoB